MMNYSANMRRRRELNRWFRRMFTVALFMGILIGFVIGWLTGKANAHHEAEPVVLVNASAVEAKPTPEPTPPVIVEPEPTPEPEPVALGTYRITAYCACEKCCGEWALNRPNGIVYGAAGIELVAGVSCASPLPFGTEVIVEGLGEFVVQDRMANWVVEEYGENLIDIYFEDHEAARQFGVKYLNVFQKGDIADDQL